MYYKFGRVEEKCAQFIFHLNHFCCRCVLSFVGVYYITSERKQEESDEQLLLTNADLFPGMSLVMDLYVAHKRFLCKVCLYWLNSSASDE